MKVYFIPGLGADKRVFRHIHLPEPFEPVYLNWMQPLKDESLHHYALRLAENINTNEPFIIAGLSMGGMIAIEIAKRYNPVFTILISSISNSGNLPFYYKTLGKLRLHKLLPVSLFKSASLLKRAFTAETSEDKRIIRELIRDTDPAFISWAINAILQWKCEAFTQPYIHIHGSTDMILPCRYTKPTHIIPKAGHMMVLTKANDINQILTDTLCRQINRSINKPTN